MNTNWIPFKTEWDEDDGEYNIINKIPKDGQDILVTYCIKTGEVFVHQDVFFITDGECKLESGYSIAHDAVAWMPLPSPCINDDERKTYLEDFLEKYPNTERVNGIPKICRDLIYLEESECCFNCDECWNRKMEVK